MRPARAGQSPSGPGPGIVRLRNCPVAERRNYDERADCASPAGLTRPQATRSWRFLMRIKIWPPLTLALLFPGLAAALVLAPPPASAAAAASGPAAAAAPDFTVTVSPASQTRKRGTGAPYFVTINCLSGFDAPVSLSLSGDIPPNGVVSISSPTGCGD